MHPVKFINPIISTIMKKVLFPLLMLSFIISACNKVAEQKPFLATDVDSITIKDGAGNPYRIKVKYTLGYDSTDIINRIVFSEKELTEFVSGIYSNLKSECKYPRTFKPVSLMGFEVLDTINIDGENILHIKVLATGVASNAFGVEGDISDILDLLAWKQMCKPLSEEETKEAINEGENPYDYTYFWHIYDNEEYWLNIIKKDITRMHEN